MRRRRRIRVPASSANLGPASTCSPRRWRCTSRSRWWRRGTSAWSPTSRSPATAATSSSAGSPVSAPPDDFEFRITSDVPLSGGLGTSAAAYVAGLLAADSIFELDADVLALATELEGHPDNVAAALLGGIVLCADGEATRFDPPAGLEAVLVVPHRHVRTAKARAALPGEVPMADAVFNVAHASLLVLGLAHGPPRPRRPRPRRPPAPAAPAVALPGVDGAAGPRDGVRRARRLDLRRRPDGARLEPVRRDRGRGRAAAQRRRTGWADVMRVPFEPQGADVRALM